MVVRQTFHLELLLGILEKTSVRGYYHRLAQLTEEKIPRILDQKDSSGIIECNHSKLPSAHELFLDDILQSLFGFNSIVHF